MSMVFVMNEFLLHILSDSLADILLIVFPFFFIIKLCICVNSIPLPYYQQLFFSTLAVKSRLILSARLTAEAGQTVLLPAVDRLIRPSSIMTVLYPVLLKY